MTFRRRHRTAPRPRATSTGRSFIRDANGSVQPKAFTYDPKYSVYTWKRAVRWCDMTRPATSTSSTWAIAIPRLYETAYPVRNGDCHRPAPPRWRSVFTDKDVRFGAQLRERARLTAKRRARIWHSLRVASRSRGRWRMEPTTTSPTFSSRSTERGIKPQFVMSSAICVATVKGSHLRGM